MAQSKVPKFGDWGDGDVGYTVCFDAARKGKPGGPLVNPNDIQMNQPASQARSPPKSKPQQQPPQQQQQPKFGAWEGGDQVPYTQYFENKGKTIPNEPQMSRDAGPARQPKAHPKQQQPPPKFGAWDSGDEVPYTKYFEKQSKMIPNEPQMNRDVGPTRQSKSPPQHKEGNAAREANHRNPKPQGVKFAGGEPSRNNQQRPPAPRPSNPGGRGPSVPAFGDWNNNPGQPGGYTVVFDKLHDEKKQGNNVPIVDNPPARNRTPTQPIKQPKQSGCFSRLFW